MKESGARRIFFYNWPTYAGTWAAAAVVIAAGLAHATVLAPVLVVAGVVALVWSAAAVERRVTPWVMALALERA